ncbi:MAG TPA: molybdenum cofactor biosynthesis protein B [Planctomycetota bacterium]|jgi:molybdenum cofactor biosynthesis protein B|nr:molybdenum cofactor biosynthesis protein B [Planctomycetota bacterium]
MGLQEHRRDAPRAIGFAVITVSDTREPATDRGGDTLVRAVGDAGHRVAWRTLVRDEAPEIEAAVQAATSREDADLVLLTGGTGIAPRDVTAPTVERLFESAIPGFGELFRWLSFREIGSAAILSRATAGLVRGKVVIALPGSPKALELAMREIVLPEAGHLVAQARGPASD